MWTSKSGNFILAGCTLKISFGFCMGMKGSFLAESEEGWQNLEKQLVE